jgi:catechol 2,3-dioxygenase-like lactoylglutathione lyase family enzyme
MDISLGHCFVNVADVDESLTFYRDALGLEVRNDVATEAGRWVTLSSPTQPDVQLIMTTPESGRSQQDADQLLALITKGSMSGLLFKTSDLDATFEKVRASGAEVLQEPIAQPWGAKDCAFRDPSGNMVRISQA